MKNSFEGGETSQNAVEKREQEKQKMEIVVMLGASLRETPNAQFEHFPLHLDTTKKDMPIGRDGKPKEVSGGDSRLRALEEYQEKYPNIHIFTTGGTEKIKKEDGSIKEISRADAAREKLLKKYHFSENIVTALPSGGSTQGNAKALASWVDEHREIVGKLEKMHILTNEFHMTRAWIMFVHALYSIEHDGANLINIITEEDKKNIKDILHNTLEDRDNGDHQALEKIRKIYAEYIKDLPVEVEPIIVEDVLAASKEKGKQEYARLIKYDSLVQKARFNERKGIGDLLDGTYVVR